MYTINLHKEPFKFSCSHFTILTPTYAERLHGHNYQVRVTIAFHDVDPKLGLAFDFNSVKPLIRSFCDELDERILIPLNSPYLNLKDTGDQIEVQFLKKKYVFPKEDTLTLPIVNITTEELAKHACERIAKDMKDIPSWTQIKVSVEETRGQSVSYRLNR